MKKLLLITLTVIASSIFVVEAKSDKYSTSLNFAQVTKVIATQEENGHWCFGTTVRHNDQGWKHYANGWEVVDMSGKKLGERVLYHPHDNEQPFTRSECDIKIPTSIKKVIVRAKCNLHGFGGKPMVVLLKPERNLIAKEQ